MKRIIVMLLAGLAFTSFALPRNDEWKKEMEKLLYEFMSCGGATSSNTPCNEFLGNALKKVYGIKDFDKPGGRYMKANDIADHVALQKNTWTLLGKASDQKVLDEAQGYANVKKAVIAVYKADAGPGHVALILPGTTTASGSWGLKCPNSASFLLNNPQAAYISKHLGNAFGADKKDKVLIYGRNY